MSSELDDRTLLRSYAESECEEAFATLVARHIDHVYSVAYRECADAHQAEELAQAAFIILARKAGSLSPDIILSGWLFQTVRFAAHNARRSEQRRQRHEQEVVSMAHDNENDDTLWEQVAPLLNDALAALSRADRDAITLRFFEKNSHAEIAAALHLNEAAVRKRLSRSVERIRALLAQRGVAVPAAVLLGLLMTHSVQAAPPLFVAGVTAACAGTTSVSTSTLASSTLKLMAWSKLKTATATAACVLIAGGAAVIAPKFSNDSARSRTLPDGSILTVTQLDLASRVNYRYQSSLSGWQTIARKILPESLAGKLDKGRSSASMSLSSADGMESLFIATTHERLPSKPQFDIRRLQVAGEDGSVFDGVFSAGTMSFPNERFEGWRVYAFPRRSRSPTLKFFYPDMTGKWIEAAQIAVPNPAPGSFPVWRAEPLPVVQTNGDVTASLVQFEAGGPQLGVNEATSKFWRSLPGTHCVFDIHQSGKDAASWTVGALQISDATGNKWSQSDLVSWADVENAARLHTSMVGALWAGEPAWNLRLELSRTNDFSADELLTLTNLPVPEFGEVVDLNNSQFVNEVSLDTCNWWSGRGTAISLQMARQQGTDESGCIRARRHGTQSVSLVNVCDDQGRAVPFEDKRGLYDRGELVFGFLAKSDAKSLSFTFAVHDSRFFEFRAKPNDASSTTRKRP